MYRLTLDLLQKYFYPTLTLPVYGEGTQYYSVKKIDQPKISVEKRNLRSLDSQNRSEKSLTEQYWEGTKSSPRSRGD
ncbi:hypothetical protein NIES4106_38110 [Fischerella sp. NIES-4106]|nr:hypothetical protein NIES4106_38110 [Fischerella sp. NIES-4106]